MTYIKPLCLISNAISAEMAGKRLGKRFSIGNCSWIVHLAPFTCKPEGIAQCIMFSTKEELPVLAVYCDEQTSRAGMLTGLETFTDMIALKKVGSLSN